MLFIMEFSRADEIAENRVIEVARNTRLGYPSPPNRLGGDSGPNLTTFQRSAVKSIIAVTCSIALVRSGAVREQVVDFFMALRPGQ